MTNYRRITFTTLNGACAGLILSRVAATHCGRGALLRLDGVVTDEHRLLARATGIVANLLEGPNCVEGTALLMEVGQRLGYTLAPQPVSLFATSSDGHVATGTTGRAFGENYLASRGGVDVAGEFVGGTPFQREAGHMILVSREHHLLLDPTFSQFKKLGPAAIAMFVEQVDSAGKQREYWIVEDESFYVRYFATPGFMPDDFPGVRQALSEAADTIVANLYEYQHEE